MKRVVVVGSGAGGAAAARELQGAFDVTVLEAGREFRPFSMNLRFPERIKRAGLLFDERSIGLLFPAMRVGRSSGGMVLVRGAATGGTTTLSTANALRMDADLKRIGVDLDAEFGELERDVPVSTAHRRRWRDETRRLYDVFGEMGLEPRVTPKMSDGERCTNCGRCVLGCPTGAKWDSRRFLADALAAGARLETGVRVDEVVASGGEAGGVRGRTARGRRVIFPADVVVLAAGGFGTPRILRRSGVECEPRLFVDPVLCVACERPGALLNRDIPMPFVAQREHWMLSPYFDHLSYFFNGRWKPPAGNILSLMIKLADENSGSVTARGRVEKVLTALDRDRLEEAAGECVRILERLGVRRSAIFRGTVNAGHPGGTLPLTAAEAETLRSPRLPRNVYVADATLLPRSLGNPPILTIMALAKRVAKAVKKVHG